MKDISKWRIYISTKALTIVWVVDFDQSDMSICLFRKEALWKQTFGDLIRCNAYLRASTLQLVPYKGRLKISLYRSIDVGWKYQCFRYNLCKRIEFHFSIRFVITIWILSIERNDDSWGIDVPQSKPVRTTSYGLQIWRIIRFRRFHTQLHYLWVRDQDRYTNNYNEIFGWDRKNWYQRKGRIRIFQGLG